jgi:hypothetical protein
LTSQGNSARPSHFVSERGAPLSAPGFSRMVERPGLAAKLRSMLICSAMPVGMCWPTLDTTRGHCGPMSAIGISRTQSALLHSRRIGSRDFDGISQWDPNRSGGHSNTSDANRIRMATQSLGIPVGCAKQSALQIWGNFRHSSRRKDKSVRQQQLERLSHRRRQLQICKTWQRSKEILKSH